MQVGSGHASRVIIDGSETLRPGNLKFDVVAGTCGTADRGGINKDGSNE